MSNYENAPATKLLATHCAACSRPLVDSASVTAGLGPECRKRYGVGQIPEAQRVEANELIYKLALVNSGHVVEGSTESMINRLKELGLEKLVAKLVKGMCVFTVETLESGDLKIKSKFDERTIEAWRNIPGRFFDKEAKANIVPQTAKKAVWDLFKTFYPGGLGYGSKGIFKIA